MCSSDLAQRLGANVVVFSSAASSLNKGETLLDTMRLFEAMGSALVVVRHPSSGVPVWLARQLDRMGVINAGDGMHEHPTQGLLDLLTLQDAWEGRFEGRRLAIVGDIAHSRVARSAIAGLTTLGARVTVCGPGTLMPADVALLGCDVAPTIEDALAGADAVYDAAFRRAGMLRVQDIDELFDAVATLAYPPKSAGDRLAILTNGGGLGVLEIGRAHV